MNNSLEEYISPQLISACSQSSGEHSEGFLSSITVSKMEWPGPPVVLNTRPGIHRGRLGSDFIPRQPMYVADANGMLVPSVAVSGVHRSASARRSVPAQVVINNEFEGHSPVRRNHSRRRHSSHGRAHDYVYDSSSSSDEYEHSPARRHRKPGKGRKTPSPSPSRSPSQTLEYERKMKKLEELEKKEEMEALKARYDEERMIEEAKKAKKKKEEAEFKKKAVEEYELEKAEQHKKDAEARQRAIDEYERQKADEHARKEKEKKEADEEFERRVKKTFGQVGYDEESIQKVLEKAEKGEKVHHKKCKEANKILDLRRPTFVKVHRKHISPETLDAFDLPWQWDTVRFPPPPPPPPPLPFHFLPSKINIRCMNANIHSSATPTTYSSTNGFPSTIKPSCSNIRANCARSGGCWIRGSRLSARGIS